jgi:hypothetical protein
MRRWFAAAIVATMSSCSLFTSLGGLSSDADEPQTDGGGGGGDAGGGDGGTPDGMEADGSTGPFCATTDASFCEDFDDPDDPTFRDWLPRTDNGGLLAKVDTAVSPPSALSVTAPYVATKQVSASLGKSFTNTKRLRWAYRFRIEEKDDSSDAFVAFGQVTMTTTGGALSSVRMTIRNLTAHFEGAIYPAGTASTASFPNLTNDFTVTAGTWHSVDMSIDWEVSPAIATVEYDGMRLSDKRAMTGSTFGPGNLAVFAGIYYREKGTTPWRILVDDSAIWVE